MDEAPRILDLDEQTGPDYSDLDQEPVSYYDKDKSKDYYLGKVDGIQEITWTKCHDCGDGYGVEREEGEPWFHVRVNGKRTKCKAQVEQNHIHKAKGDSRTAHLDSRYGGMWHTSYRIKDDKWTDDKCYCCFERPTQRIDVNCHGTVAEFDVCDRHAKYYDGKCCDMVSKRNDLNPDDLPRCRICCKFKVINENYVCNECYGSHAPPREWDGPWVEWDHTS